MVLLVSAIQEYAIFMLDPSGHVLTWNAGAKRIKGYSFDEIKGKHFSVFYPQEQVRADKPQQALEMALATGRFEEDGIRLRKDGSSFWANVLITPVYDGSDKLRGFAKVTKDITERRKADLEVNRSNLALEQFAYVAAHDLQEPLRTVVSYLGLLEERYQGKLDEKADKYIRNAVHGARRMQQLIADLLSYSRISTRAQKFEAVDCEKLLAAVVNDLQTSIEESGAQIINGPLPTVLADQRQLSQVFQNLIANSIKYRRSEPPKIEISAEQSGSNWLFSFKDNGIGFEMKYAERIFLVFQRLHGRTQYSGSGIGLGICQRVIERLGGTIWATGESGQGATFQFTIPNENSSSR
jgi:PAS domain S-box-containing protein